MLEASGDNLSLVQAPCSYLFSLLSAGSGCKVACTTEQLLDNQYRCFEFHNCPIYLLLAQATMQTAAQLLQSCLDHFGRMHTNLQPSEYKGGKLVHPLPIAV